MITEEALHQLFTSISEKSTMTFIGRCLSCGNKIKIGITRTTRGFGFEGGMLFDVTPDECFVKCIDCYQKWRKGS